MLKEPTTLVLGAGASFDLGFPLGGQLSKRIQEHCREYLEQNECFIRLAEPHGAFGRQPVIDLASRVLALRRGLPTTKSVDDFLFRRSDDELLARLVKVCIAAEIVRCERECVKVIRDGWGHTPFSVAVDANSQRQNFWASDLLVKVFQGVRHATRDSDLPAALLNFSIVTFNYDRSFEYFFIEFVRAAFDTTWEYAEQIAKQHLQISHVYGCISDHKSPHGTLERQFDNDSKFEAPRNVAHIVRGAEGIRTIHETQIDATELERAKSYLDNANKLLFIGNSFIEQNMRLLSDSTLQPNIYGTAFGLSDEHKHQAIGLLNECFEPSHTPILEQKWTAGRMMADIVETL